MKYATAFEILYAMLITKIRKKDFRATKSREKGSMGKKYVKKKNALFSYVI